MVIERTIGKSIARTLRGAVPGSGGAGGPLVYDTFTDADSTALTAHTPDVDTVGGGWIEAAPAGGQITSNQAQTTVVRNEIPHYYIETGASDVLVSLDYASGVNQVGPCARVVSAGNCWLFYAADGTLYETNAHVATARASVSPVSPPTTMNIQGSGDQISVWFDAESSASYTSTQHQSGTSHGIRMRTTGSLVDNFTVTAL